MNTTALRTTPIAPAKRIVFAACVLAVLVGAWFAWKDVVSPRVFPKRFGVVVDHALYRAGRIHPALLPKLIATYGIDDVIALTFAPNAPEYVELEASLAKDGIHVLRFPLLGNGTG